MDDGDQKVGEIFAAWQVTPSSLMLLGWQHERPAVEGAAALQDANVDSGRFVGAAWPVMIGRDRAYRFLTAVQLPHAGVHGDTTLLLTGKRVSDDAVLARLPPLFLDPAGFGTELARAAGGDAAIPVVRFLLKVFSASVIAANPTVRAMIGSFFDGAAESAGCIEILGSVGDHCAIMQGWGRPLDPDGEIILADASVRVCTAREAVFARPDIGAPSAGHVLILPAADAVTGPAEAVYLLGPSGLRRRPVLPEPQRLSGERAAMHLRDLVPQLRCVAATRALLTDALRPAYDGRVTMYDCGHPVRISVDIAVFAPGAGLYLTGWLYDPASVVENVSVHQGRRAIGRLDSGWTRILRPDVTEAFAADPLLPGCDAAQQDHGFARHLPSLDSTAPDGWYLEVTFKDGWCGFLPLSCQRACTAAEQARLLASVDLYKPSGVAVIEEQLAPFLSRLALPPHPQEAASPALQPFCGTLIVVPLPSAEIPRSLLAHLLDDPLTEQETLVFVCGDNWTKAAEATLSNLARFYGASVLVAKVAGRANAATALRVAGAWETVCQVLLLGASTVGVSRGWRHALSAAARDRGGSACVSPTVLYEDGSVQFAGCGPLEGLTAMPYVRLNRDFAGFPAASVVTNQITITQGVSIACCLLPHWVVQFMAGAAIPAIAAGEAELGLLLLLSTAAPECLWIPAIQVYAPEDTAPVDLAYKAERLAALWCIRAALSPRESLPCVY